MKIVITSNLTYPHIGGIENSIRHLASEGVKVGDEIIIVSSNQPCDDSENNKNHEYAHSHFYYNSYYWAPQPFRFILNLISATITYRRVLRKYNPDVTIARYHLNVIATRMAGLKNIVYLVPGVVKYQDNKTNRKKSNLISHSINKASQWIAFAISDKVAAFSDIMTIQIQKARNGTVVHRVKPGISLERFHQECRKTTYSPEKVELLFVGRLVSAKGINIAIEALSILPNNFLLTVVGDGEERKNLEMLTEKLNLKSRVCFIGSTNAPEEFYKRSDIFLFTSIYEPFGQTLLEATASKLPVVAFTPSNFVNTATKQILGEYAFYSHEFSKESLAQQIQNAYTETYINKIIDMEMLSEKIVEQYSWRTLYNQLKDLQQ
ncbi:glycosyltransferase family 4 protein [Limnobacter sp. 130]|uniref:glycosyltransferase family 4 protein n=1 Tax=Limnobacter sp. 130 TaxID=2653147 RepID=UPI00135B7024|nr:glycosyltransferase [Limnobacter sp. 130]